MSIQSELISYITGVKYQDLPVSVIETTKKCVLDTLAAIIAGSTDEYIPELVELVKGMGGREECLIPIYGGKVPAPTAAFVNCTMARARDIDDAHYGGSGHLSATIVPSGFVISEYCKMFKGRPINGKDFILANVIGADLICRIAMAGYPFRGWTSETWGPFAVAAAGGKLLGFDGAKIRDVLGIAYARLCGNSQVYGEGAYTARLQNGFAGEGGVLAIVLAEHGLKGPEEILEGTFGLFPLYFRGEYSRELFLADLGRRFEGANVKLKLYPVAGGVQAATHACIELAKKHEIKANNVKKVNISLNTFMKEGLGTEKKRKPESIPDAQFSLYYGPAVGLLKGNVWLEDFTEQAIRRPDVLEMCRRIEVFADPAKDALKVHIPPTDVEIETKDGKRHKLHVESIPGYPENPLSWAELNQKLKDCVPWSARPLSINNIDKISEMVEDLDRLDDVTAILEFLV